MPYHFNSTPLAPGSIILPGNWGRIIRRAGVRHTLYKREMLMENIRSSEFPGLPSRLDCAYFFEYRDLAEAYGKADPVRYITGVLYEVELLQPRAVQHHANWQKLPHHQTPLEEDARLYWHGSNEEDLTARTVEVLSITELKIVRAIDY